MPRIARVAPGGVVYHVLNRGNGPLIFYLDARITLPPSSRRDEEAGHH